MGMGTKEILMGCGRCILTIKKIVQRGNNMSKFVCLILLGFGLSVNLWAVEYSKDTLPPISPDDLPADIPALWETFDPAKDPVDLKVLHEYEHEGVTIQMISYLVGIFKGEQVRMGAYLAFPTNRGERLPGVIQVHGGGQRANADSCFGIARNGYAVLATNWGGRLMQHQEEGQPGEGTVGTKWAPLDATQKHNGWYARTEPDHLTYDDFDSPRNNNWFLINLANKRGITLLQQLDFVDPEKIGVHGHSMGGKLSVMLAGTDKRVKVAVPSCGGTGAAPDALKARKGNSARPQALKPLYAKYIDDAKMLPYVTCPIMYQGPHNDFNGMLSNLAFNWRAIPEETPVRFSISPHLNHRHILESAFVDLLMFEQYLKGRYELPKTPVIKVDLKGDATGPRIILKADPSKEIDRVEIFYSQDPNGQFRFRRSAEIVKQEENIYLATAPVMSTDLGFFAMANVYYKHPKELKLQGPRWRKDPGDTYVISTNVQMFEIPEVKAANPAVTDVSTRMVQQSFEEDGKPDWYRYSQDKLHTRKIRDPKWRGPVGAKLSIQVLDPVAEHLIMEFTFNSYSKYGREYPAGDFYCAIPVKASDEWQHVEIDITDLKAKKSDQTGMPKDWQTLDHLTIAHNLDVVEDGQQKHYKSNAKHGQGRNIRNLQWVGGTYPQTILMNGGGIELSGDDYEKQFNSQIDDSIELEEKVDRIKKADD